MQQVKYDGNTVVAWSEVGWQPKVEAPAKTMKLSEVVRTHGYGEWADPTDCVLGRAYKRVMGHNSRDRCRYGLSSATYSHAASQAFNTPHSICKDAERMCMRGKSHIEIADWLESQGY